jgi:tRNA A-37 threonylcarbamoyl transferase component Bud32
MDANALDEERPGADVSVAMVEVSAPAEALAAAHGPGELVVGKYRLEKPLGAGGQAAVWEARNLGLDARVALKLLHDGTPDEAQAMRLLREARAVARLGHPAVVRVFDLDRMPSGEWFIVMELLEGQSLADLLLERGRLSAREAVPMLLPIVDALGAAHGLGIVHRDVKPDNVFLARAGAGMQPKLLDFGVAKLEREQALGWHTAAGTVLGTPAYLSPEQAEGLGDIDHRSDIWSLSATLYECVTGHLPFDGDTDDELFSQIAERDPASIVDHAAGDPALWAIVRRGLAKRRQDRWASMQDFGEALARWLFERGIAHDAGGVSLRGRWLPAELAGHQAHPTLPPATPAATRWVLAGTTAVVLLLSMLAFAMWQEKPAPLGPPEPVPARTAAATSTVSPSVVPVTPGHAARSVDLPESSRERDSVAPAAAAAAGTVHGESRPKGTPDRLRPAHSVAEPKSLDLISPYR